MAVHGQEAHERMGEWQTLAGDRGEHAGLRGGTARVSDAARQSQAGASAEDLRLGAGLSRAWPGAAGGGGGLRGLLLVSVLLLLGVAGADGATTCQKSKFEYSSGPCLGVSFDVERCAESADALKEWMQVKIPTSPLFLSLHVSSLSFSVCLCLSLFLSRARALSRDAWRPWPGLKTER